MNYSAICRNAGKDSDLYSQTQSIPKRGAGKLTAPAAVEPSCDAGHTPHTCCRVKNTDALQDANGRTAFVFCTAA